VILVSQNYLGSINHTLLSVSTLKQHNISIKGIVFNGNDDHDSEKFIRSHCQVPFMDHIPYLESMNKISIINAGRDLSL